ncbi:MAG: hypothetical protein ACREQO_16580 [Candidatus Binatia bacterium]
MALGIGLFKSKFEFSIIHYQLSISGVTIFVPLHKTDSPDGAAGEGIAMLDCKTWPLNKTITAFSNTVKKSASFGHGHP